MSSVGGDVAALMVRVEHQVQPGGLLEIFRVVDTEHLGVVPGPVELRVVLRLGAALECPRIDLGGDNRDLGHEVEGVLQGDVPVGILLHALLVLLRELRVLLQSEHADGELRHGMRVLGQGLECFPHVRRDGAPRVELSCEGAHVVVRRHLACEQQPEGRLGQGALAARRFGQFLVALEQRQPAVGDALRRVEVRGLSDHGLNGTRAVDALLDGDLLDFRLAGLQQLRLQGGALLRQGGDLALELGIDRGGRSGDGRRQRPGGRAARRDVRGDDVDPAHRCWRGGGARPVQNTGNRGDGVP
mmetsp:Transcript_44425/g.129171  ORF Transcript_44425/g.129171 Transcript_44425/m.129171 type:complete len:301 (-) Transcript_44425:3-905(-)